MHYMRKEPVKPFFNPDFIRRHITPEWVRSHIVSTLEAHKKQEKRSFYDRIPTADEFGTDKALMRAIPHSSENPVQGKILDILVDMRAEGLLQKIPHGADRNISHVIEWNNFIDGGLDAKPKYGWRSLMELPLCKMISGAMFSAGHSVIGDVRVAAGLDRYPGDNETSRTGSKALMPYTDAMIDDMANSCAQIAALCGSGEMGFISMGDSVTCPKTDQRLAWAEDELLSPRLGIMHYNPSRFEPLEAFDKPKPIRHVEIQVPSGELFFADWFRIKGFTEGVQGGKEEDYSKPSISSDLGADERTQDHFERLGLMRIHTTNCVPSIFKEGDNFRVGNWDEDHDDFWTPNPEDPDDYVRSAVPAPNKVGSVCCDLWDVTFADRTVLEDITHEWSGVC